MNKLKKIANTSQRRLKILYKIAGVGRRIGSDWRVVNDCGLLCKVNITKKN